MKRLSLGMFDVLEFFERHGEIASVGVVYAGTIKALRERGLIEPSKFEPSCPVPLPSHWRITAEGRRVLAERDEEIKKQLQETQMSSKRMVAWTDESLRVEGQGYRVAFVTEGEPGYTPTGDWPYEGKPGQKLPWFYGPTIEDARRQCQTQNDNMGIDVETAFKIVAESMAMGTLR